MSTDLDNFKTYRINREPFTTILKGHLLSKTFLFLGFSFEDPNLSNILSWIKNLLGTNVREHYCLFEKVSIRPKETQEDFAYRKAKQDLIVDDLKRYGIQAVLLESYSEIPNVLKQIEKRCNLNNIFVSGSMSMDNDQWTTDSAKLFASSLVQQLVADGLHITSGYGVEIGNAIISGVLNEVKQKKYAHFDEYLKLYPFPQPKLGEDFKELWHNYRAEIIKDCGAIVFIFGNKIDKEGNKIVADGMLDEYEVARNQNTIMIPIASTGDAAQQIFDEMYKNRHEYNYLTNYWDILKNETDIKKISKIIKEIIEKSI